MTCPHCGADATAGQKFCPNVLPAGGFAAAEDQAADRCGAQEIRRDLNAARTVRFRHRRLRWRHTTPLPLPVPQYQVRVATPNYPPAPAPYKYAPHPRRRPG